VLEWLRSHMGGAVTALLFLFFNFISLNIYTVPKRFNVLNYMNKF
jgi:hypothetical protein